jgi:transposase InsO family protein
MGKNSAYREFKRRERATQLAAEAGITFEAALIQIEARAKAAGKILAKNAKSRKKEVQAKESKNKRDQFEKFKTQVTPGTRPVQGGSPGLGKR